MKKIAALFLVLASLNAEAGWTSFVLHVNEGTDVSARRMDLPSGSWLDGVCWISVPKWNAENLGSWGSALGFCVNGKLEAAPTNVSDGSRDHQGTHNWTSFVIHVREGEVEGAAVGGKCYGPDKEGKKRTGGCARWRASLPNARLNGECFVTVKRWSTQRRIMGNWGHELGHCVKGMWHE